MNKLIHFPLYGWIGLIVLLISWYLNWNLDSLRTHWGFFFLWFGYSIFVDAVVFYRKGTSLITRNKKLFFSLFLISIPVWWLFELYNLRTENWFYDGKQFFTNFEYFLLASLSFSTVMPAVFGTAEFAGTFNWLKKISLKKINPDEKILKSLILAGILIVLLIIIFPKIFYPLVWVSVFLLVEPLNVRFGFNSLFEHISKGDWKPVFALALGGLICGFFWEMWNFYSYPQWKYYLPGVNVLHVFEMPLSGYIGYLPFPLELFAIYNFITGLLKVKDTGSYLKF
jgi:hypothetical protein